MLRKILEIFQRYRSFRILVAKTYPIFKKFKIISLLKKLNKGSFSDSWGHFSDYDSLEKEYCVDFKKLVTQKKNYKFGFLLCPDEEDTLLIENIKNSCSILGVQFIIYDIKSSLLYKEISRSDCDGIFIIPAYENNLIRILFHESIHILSSETGLYIYPTLRELNIYESKRSLANFLEINDIPHPSIKVFYDFGSAKKYLEVSTFPIVFKTHIGASSSGVEILQNKKQALKLARQIFYKYYLRKLEIEKRAFEWGYMILQEYIEDVQEYRIIKVGDSWFGYQKWKNEHQVFMSGSGVLKWINPSEDLLNFCYNIASRYNFTTMCFDIFKNKQGEFLVNELQTWFGSYDPTEMYVDNIPGRYCRIEGEWIFRPGFYNIYGTILLRLTHFISILQKEKQF